MGKKKGKGKSQPAQGAASSTGVPGQTNPPHQEDSGSQQGQQGPQHSRRWQQSEHQAGPSQLPSAHQQEEKTTSQKGVGPANIRDPRSDYERRRQPHSVPTQQHSTPSQQYNSPPPQAQGVWGQKKVWGEPSPTVQAPQQQSGSSSCPEPSQSWQPRGPPRDGKRPQHSGPRTDGGQLSQQQRPPQDRRPQQQSQKTEYRHQGSRQQGGERPQQQSQKSEYKLQGDRQQGDRPQGGRSQQNLSQRQPQSDEPKRDQQMKDSSPTKSSSEMQIEEALPSRQLVKSKPGTKGRKIRLETNHFPLNLGKLKSAIHYDVALVPDTPKKYLRHVIEQFRSKHFPNRFPAFDGKKNLYSSTRLPFNDFITDEIVIKEPDGRDKKYKVEIKFANEVDLTALKNYELSEKTPSEALQVVDIVLRSAPALTFISVGRSFFHKPLENNFDLGEGMEMYSGFYQSAMRGWKPYLNVDVAHKAFPKPQNVVDALIELFNSRNRPFGRDNLQEALDRYRRTAFEQFIKNLKVTYEIPNIPSSKRSYTVNGIDQATRDKVFELDNGRQTTIENYFLSEKEYRIKYPLLPSLWVGNKARTNRILLPLELCTIEGGQVVNRKLTENQTRAMIKHSAKGTDVRKQKIQDSLVKADYNRNPTVNEFGFSVTGQFQKLEGRVLQPPDLEYKDETVRPARGQWRGSKFQEGVKINKWTIVCADQRLSPREDVLDYLAKMISNCGASCGMSITSGPDKPFKAIGNFMNDIRKFFLAQQEKKYDVIFVVVPNYGKQYSYVKTAAEINSGCLTQCIKLNTLIKSLNPTTVTNILLKVNAKLNGTNHFLSVPPSVMTSACMIMGADVTHPGPEATIPSVVAVTASHDFGAFQYNICWRLQPPRTEIIRDLEAITVEHLKYYQLKRSCLPEKILVFRDGVSEGEFDKVRNKEIIAIKSACRKMQPGGGYQPKITFLVVQKRHHTRLFPLNQRDCEDRNNNVPAGTCVDTEITHHFMQDFYLVSHASIQGVAKPTKYRTLWDENEMTNDDIEELTYHLCHMFSRCNRSVSYPAPTYYAHLAAARARVYIENIENLDMDNLQREYNRCKIQDAIIKDKPMFFV